MSQLFVLGMSSRRLWRETQSLITQSNCVTSLDFYGLASLCSKPTDLSAKQEQLAWSLSMLNYCSVKGSSSEHRNENCEVETQTIHLEKFPLFTYDCTIPSLTRKVGCSSKKLRGWEPDLPLDLRISAAAASSRVPHQPSPASPAASDWEVGIKIETTTSTIISTDTKNKVSFSHLWLPIILLFRAFVKDHTTVEKSKPYRRT